MKKVLIIVSHYLTIYTLRRELVEKLVERNHEVYIAMPDTPEADYFKNLGCHIIDVPVDRRKTNPLKDFLLILTYRKIMNDINPDCVLTFTIKPNIYGGIAANLAHKRALHTVTGIGSVYINDLKIKRLVSFMNKEAFKHSNPIFFLNNDNVEFYKNIGIISNQKTRVVPGSGVNLKEFEYSPINLNKNIIFTFIGRILKDKGIEEYLDAARLIKSKYPETIFNVVGFVEDEKYKVMLEEFERKDIIRYLGKRNDISEIMKNSTCIVLPSYGEGRGTVLQEGAASGRPLITCNTYGCRENVDDGINGYLVDVADTKSLALGFEKIINLNISDLEDMGKNSRKKAEKEFDRNLVINAYIEEVEKGGKPH